MARTRLRSVARGGSTLFVAPPEIVAQYVASIPYGPTRTVARLRNELARRLRRDSAWLREPRLIEAGE
jgi:hypothetical protein